LQLT
jgi:hypothetical protein